MNLRHPEHILEQAVKSALEQMIRISKFNPNERRPKEAIIQFELYRHYSNLGYIVSPEAGYFPADDSRKWSCDLRIIGVKGDELWVEIKVANDGGGLKTAIPEEKKKWIKDGEKLDYAPKTSRAVFLLVGLTEGDPESSESQFIQEVDRFWDGKYGFQKVDTKPITWPHAGVKYVTAWYWKW